MTAPARSLPLASARTLPQVTLRPPGVERSCWPPQGQIRPTIWGIEIAERHTLAASEAILLLAIMEPLTHLTLETLSDEPLSA